MVFLFGFSAVEHKNPLLQLKQSGVGIGVGRVKRRYKRKNAVSPVKKGPSPVKRHLMMASPAKTLPPPMKSREPMNVVKVSILTVSYMKLKVFFCVVTVNSSSNSRLFLFSQTEYGPSTSTSKPDVPESKSIPRTAPALAGAYDLTDIKTLLREWVTTMTGTQRKNMLSHSASSCRYLCCLYGCKNAFLSLLPFC